MKGIVFHQYDGTGNFQQWKEEMTLVLLANDMWCFIEGEDLGEKKTVENRKQRAFAYIALNLSTSCRDCLRHLGSRDPKEAWKAVLARFERTTAASKMAVLDSLLNLRCGDSNLDYISQFNEYVNRLTSMEEKLGRDLKIAILLRGLPQRYDYLVGMIKVRENLPELEEVIQLISLEHQADSGPRLRAYTADAFKCDHRNHEVSRCWKLHPELAPICNMCRQRGHLQKRCPSRKGAVERPVEQTTANYVKQEVDYVLDDMPPISL
jgi:hypothetical protein